MSNVKVANHRGSFFLEDASLEEHKRVRFEAERNIEMKLNSYLRIQYLIASLAGLVGLLSAVNVASAQPWQATTAPVLGRYIAASADFTKLVSVGWWVNYPFDGTGPASYEPIPIFVSSDSGVTWAQATNAPTNLWGGIASSADGAKLVACSRGQGPGLATGLIYRSVDSGQNWVESNAPSNAWTAVASSADGMKLFAAAKVTVATPFFNVGDSDGLIYTSTNSGTTWTPTTAPSNNWLSVACSADGTRILAGADAGDSLNGTLYISTNSGGTWTQEALGLSYTPEIVSVAASSDGIKLVAATLFDGIYVSTNGGAVWTETDVYDYLNSVACSADGMTIMAASDYHSGAGLIYTSTNQGASWVSNESPYDSWSAVALAADGHKALAVAGSIFGTGQTYSWPYSGPWRQAQAPLSDWTSVTSSGDGSHVAAVAAPGSIWTSTDSGATWTPTSSPTNQWGASLVSSTNGTILVTTASVDGSGTGIYISTDAGATWTQTSAPSNSWASVAASADGAKLVAAAALGYGDGTGGDGAIYASTNFGTTWTRTVAPTNNWISVTSSADGSRLAVAADEWPNGDGLIYTSTNSGRSWSQTSALSNAWISVASSADGIKLVAAGQYALYVSTNGGLLWTASPDSYDVNLVACSADGMTMAAVAYQGIGGDGQISISSDSGTTWTSAHAPCLSWQGIALSDGASNIVATSEHTGIYTLASASPSLPPIPSPVLQITRPGADFGLSWLIPSTRFVLQQNSDLDSTNWIDLPASPAFNFTNLHYEVTVPPTSRQSFYRLNNREKRTAQ